MNIAANTMNKRQQVVVQEQTPKFTPIQPSVLQPSRLELLFKKTSLAAMTMLGIGYILVNAPVAILVSNSISTIPVASQANISVIAGRILFLVASSLSIILGLILIYGSVQFYERGKVKESAFLGVALGSFYLLCLGTGSALLSENNPAALTLTIAPLIMVMSAALYVSSDARSRLLGSALGIMSGVVLAYAILNLRVLDLVFSWAIPFTGPFLSFTVLESMSVILAPIAVAVHTIYSYAGEERPIPHVFALLVALVYGLGTFVGSIVLSLNFWNLIWQSPWTGPFHSLPEWFMNIVVFWSASLVLMDIGGILLISVACIGFIYVARGLSRP